MSDAPIRPALHALADAIERLTDEEMCRVLFYVEAARYFSDQGRAKRELIQLLRICGP